MISSKICRRGACSRSYRSLENRDQGRFLHFHSCLLSYKWQLALFGPCLMLLVLANSVSALDITAKRFEGNPILSVDVIGDEAYDVHREANSDEYISIAGPSLIRVPDWIENPLAKYYLYFAHHKGAYIRLAYAHKLEGPWKVYNPGKGVLGLDEVEGFAFDHVASPDVHVDHRNQRIVMYYHSPYIDESLGQKTFVALSDEGLDFDPYSSEVLGKMYMRVFRYRGYFYGVPRRGPMVRSLDGLTNFEPGPDMFHYEDRHFALKLHNNRLFVFYSHELDVPETIKVMEMDISDSDWLNWHLEPNPTVVLKPELPYETNPQQVLLDPFVYQEAGKHYLFYSVAKEQGIALAYLDVPEWEALSIHEIVAKSHGKYGVARDLPRLGEHAYLDGSARFDGVPKALRKALWITTDNADVKSSGSAQDFLTFQADQAVTVYVAHDDRFERRPKWLMGWGDTGDKVKLIQGDLDINASVFSKHFKAGHIALGGNLAIDDPAPPHERLMYLVAVKSQE